MRSSTIPCKWSDYNPVTGKEGVTFITRRFTCHDIAVSCIIPCTLTIIQKFKDVIIGRSTPSPSPVGGGGIIVFAQNLLAVCGIVLGVVPILVPFVVVKGIRGLRCRLTPGEKRPDFLRLVRAHVTGGPFQAVAHLDIHMTVDHVRLQSAIHGFKRNDVEVVYSSKCCSQPLIQPSSKEYIQTTDSSPSSRSRCGLWRRLPSRPAQTNQRCRWRSP